MKQVHRSLLTSLVALAAAAGLVSFVLWRGEQRADEEAAGEARLHPLSFDINSVDAIEISRPDQRVRIERGDDHWRITSPVQDRADGVTVTRLLTAAAELTLARRFEVDDGNVDLAALKLTPPRIAIDLQLPTSRLGLHLGKRSAFDGRLYVRAGPDPGSAAVGMVEARAASALDTGLLALREKRFFPLTAAEVSAIEVQVHATDDPALSFTARRRGVADPPEAGRDQPWTLTAPAEVDADSDTLNDLLMVLTSARFSRVVEQTPGADLTSHGLDAPRYTISLSGRTAVHQLRIGAITTDTGEQLRAQRDGYTAVSDAPHALIAKLPTSIFALEEKRALIFDSATITQLKIELADGLFAVLEREREDGGAERWLLLAPRSGVARGWRVTSILHLLSRLRALRYAKIGLPAQPPAQLLIPFGLDRPRRTITLFGPEQRELATLLVGRAQGDEVFVMRQGADRVLVVERARLDELPTRLEELSEQSNRDR